MNIMELSSAEKRREENIRKNREFQMHIGFTSLVENCVASQEKIIRQDCVKRKIVLNSSRKSRRIEKQVEEERNRKEKKEIGKEFRCKYCYQIYRSTRTYPNAGALKLHQRNPKCAIYHIESTNIDTGNISYIQVYLNHSVYHR